MNKYLYAIVLPMLLIFSAIHQLMAAEISNYQTYLDSLYVGVPERERIFQAGEREYSSEEILSLGGINARKYKNIVALFDSSGSTSCDRANSGDLSGDLTIEMANEQIVKAFNNPEITRDKLTEYLLNNFRYKSRVCPCFITEEYISESIKALEKGLNLSKIDYNNSIKTKHISLAQAEGLSRIFSILSHTDSSDLNLFLLSFSSSLQEPVGINLPHKINNAKDFVDIAKNLNKILAKPSFRDTLLAPALEYAITQMKKLDPADTLLIIVTDGQTKDGKETARLLIDYSRYLQDSSKNLDIFTVGAGSILKSQVDFVKVNFGFEEYSTRFSDFCHLTGEHANFSANQCNMGYLQSLSNFKTLFGRGAYEGAFLDYSALESKFINFISDKNDTSNALYIQANDQGKWWPAKDHQYSIAEASLSSSEQIINYERNKVLVSISKLEDPVLNKNIIKVTDQYNRSRFYLCAPKYLLHFDPQTCSLSSSDHAVQNAIDFVNQQ